MRRGPRGIPVGATAGGGEAVDGTDQGPASRRAPPAPPRGHEPDPFDTQGGCPPGDRCRRKTKGVRAGGRRRKGRWWGLDRPRTPEVYARPPQPRDAPSTPRPSSLMASWVAASPKSSFGFFPFPPAFPPPPSDGLRVPGAEWGSPTPSFAASLLPAQPIDDSTRGGRGRPGARRVGERGVGETPARQGNFV